MFIYLITLRDCYCWDVSLIVWLYFPYKQFLTLEVSIQAFMFEIKKYFGLVFNLYNGVSKNLELGVGVNRRVWGKIKAY